MITILNGDCQIELKKYPDDHFHSMVTDPPYGISFMGKKWDHSVPSVDVFKECYRVLKPGAFILVACGTRTQHRMAVNIEDAGFEIRDVITWHYGSGFPKSLNVSKAIDDHFGAEREIVGKREHPTLKDKSKIDRHSNQQFHGENTIKDEWNISAPSTEVAKQYNGYGTALKPATEFWTLARKPLIGTVAENMLQHGTGGLNIDACRIAYQDEDDLASATFGRGTNIIGGNYVGATHGNGKTNIEGNPQGRWPANVIFDVYTAKLLDEQTGNLTSGAMKKSYVYQNNGYSLGAPSGSTKHFCEASNGGASRFFYCAKASAAERNKGLDNFEDKLVAAGNQAKAELKRGNTEYASASESATGFSSIQKRKNHHPTVKPIKLMQYLVKLITPAGGMVLDPYAGSGTTGVACKIDGFDAVLIDREKEYCEIGQARIDAHANEKLKDTTDTQLSLF
jgi:site-specific DNA-methyltransferase (adenine-specific)